MADTPHIERWWSPDGERIVLLDHRDGSVWISRRLGPGEAAEVMTVVPGWTHATGDDAPKEPPRKRARRSKKRAALTLVM